MGRNYGRMFASLRFASLQRLSDTLEPFGSANFAHGCAEHAV
jgi:hypothetical protein